VILAIDTATEACSVALFDHGKLVVQRHEIVGRGHAERLVPMIAELPDRGRAHALLVDCGPGSFTGLRVGLAAALALGLGWHAEVHGYSSLALMARQEFAKTGAPDRVAVAILGGHGEMFVQRFSAEPFVALSQLASLKPEAAAAVIEEPLLIGNGAAELVERSGRGEARDALPCAAYAMELPPAFRTLPAVPLYGRAPDAKPPK